MSRWLPATQGTCSWPAQWEGALTGGVLLPTTLSVAQLGKKHLLLVDAPLKEKEGKPLGREAQGSLAPGRVMQADPTEPGWSHSPWGVPSVNADLGKQLLWRVSLAAPPRLAGDTSLSSLMVRHAAKQPQRQVLAAFPWGAGRRWKTSPESN